MIDTELRAQMLAFTATDTPPVDLLRRVHSGVRRSQARRLAVVSGVAVAASVAGVAAVNGGPAPAARVVQGPADAPDAPAQAPGPSDAELRAAEWFSYESQPEQPNARRVRERRWQHRDGRHLAQQPDGSFETYATDARFPIGPDSATWDELLALPADPVELERRMHETQGGRPDDERVLDQVKQLLGRSPALTPVREALVQAALRQEGVTVREGEQDSQGRPARLLEHTDRDGAVLRLWIDPVGHRLLEERLVAGPDFPTPPTDGPVPPDAPDVPTGQLLYAEVFLAWGTAPPPSD